MKKLLTALLLLAMPSMVSAQIFTTHQGGTGVVDVSTGSILFGVTPNIRMGTSSALQFNNAASRLSFTYGSSTAQSTSNLNINSFLTFNGVSGDEWTDFCITITGAAELCDGSDASGAGGSSAYEIATTSDIGVSQLSYFSKIGGRTTLASTATTSVTCSGNTTCDPFTVLGASPITISSSGSDFNFTPTTYAGVGVNATSTGLWFKATSPYSIIASSTFSTYASSTQLTTNNNTYLAMTGGTVGIATTTPGQSSLLGVAGGAFFGGTVYAPNFYDTALTGTGCVGETEGLLNTTNCVSSIASANDKIVVSSPTGNVTLTYTGLATTSQPSSSNLLVSNGAAGVFGVATGTVSTGSTAITVTAGRSVIGGSLSIDCATSGSAQNGCLSSTDWTTFNNKQAPGFQISTTSLSQGQLAYYGTATPTNLRSVATTTFALTSFPANLTGTVGALVGGANAAYTWWGLSTSTAMAANQIVYGTAANTVGSESAFTYNSSSDLLTLLYASTTAITASGSASTSALTASNSVDLFGGGAKTTANALCIQLTGTADLCDGADASGVGGTGLATSSPVSGGNVLYYSAIGAGSATGVATSSVTAGVGITFTGTAGALVGGTALTISTGTSTVDMMNATFLPDTSGNAWVEPFTVSATNDKFLHAVAVASSTTATSTFYMSTRVPHNYGGTKAAVVMHFSCPQTSGNVTWVVQYRAIGGDDTESLDQATFQRDTSYYTKACGSAANERQEVYFELTPGDIVANDTLEVKLSRDGTQASDTAATGGAQIHDISFDYQ